MSSDEWIPNLEARETSKVAVGGPELADAVEPAKRCDAGIMDLRARHPTRPKKNGQLVEVALGFGEENESPRLEPGGDLRERFLDRRGRPEDPRVRDDRQKLVNAGPRHSPR